MSLRDGVNESYKKLSRLRLGPFAVLLQYFGGTDHKFDSVGQLLKRLLGCVWLYGGAGAGLETTFSIDFARLPGVVLLAFSTAVDLAVDEPKGWK